MVFIDKFLILLLDIKFFAYYILLVRFDIFFIRKSDDVWYFFQSNKLFRFKYSEISYFSIRFFVFDLYL